MSADAKAVRCQVITIDAQPRISVVTNLSKPNSPHHNATAIPDTYVPSDAVVVRAMDKWLFNCASMPAGMLTDQEFGIVQHAMRESIIEALAAIAQEVTDG